MWNKRRAEKLRTLPIEKLLRICNLLDVDAVSWLVCGIEARMELREQKTA